MPLRAIGGLCVTALLAGLYGCNSALNSGPDAAGQRPNILLLSVDTLRADRLGCYGHPAANTPFLDSLCAESAVFEDASSQVPLTLPSHASLLTGVIPPRHGVRLNEGHRLSGDHVTLTEILKEQGYQTAAFVGGLPMARPGGLEQGFDVYDDQLVARKQQGSHVMARRHERYAEEVFAAVDAWLAGFDATRPAFLFVHLYDPHAPYERALPGATTASYQGEVAYVDKAIASFMKSLEASGWKPGLTIITSDHGEGLGEHGEDNHGLFVYQSTLHVPLLVHWPAWIAARRISTPVSLIDVAPTVLDLLGMPQLPDTNGRSLTALLATDEEVSAAPPIYFESLMGELQYGWASLRGIRHGHVKYIEAPTAELYDLATDSGELMNLRSTRAAETDHLAGLLSGVVRGHEASAPIDPETRKKLTALGYLSAPPVAAVAAVERPDPKDRIDVYARYQSAFKAAAAGRFDEAFETFSEIESFFAASAEYYKRWGDIAGHASRWSEAIRSYELSLALDDQDQSTLLNLGVSYLKSDKPRLGLQQFDALLELNPSHVDAHLYAGIAHAKHLGNPRAAILHWERFLELAPTHAQAPTVRRSLTRLPGGGA